MRSALAFAVVGGLLALAAAGVLGLTGSRNVRGVRRVVTTRHTPR
jgi:hypothetical protein